MSSLQVLGLVVVVLVLCSCNKVVLGEAHKDEAYNQHNGKTPTCIAFPSPPPAYNIDRFLAMAKRQEGIVVDTWRQEHAWMNPSMVVDPQARDKVVMIWRMPKGRHVDYIGYNWVSRKTWKAIKNKDQIEIIDKEETWRANLIGEDARIFCHKEQLYIIYNIHMGHTKMLFYAPLHYDAKKDLKYIVHPSSQFIYSHEFNVRHEKNWTPFEYCPGCSFEDACVKTNGDVEPELLFVYTIQPHRIVQVRPYNGTAHLKQSPPHNSPGQHQLDRSKQLMYNAETVFLTDIEYDDDWRWGEMRGGTPAVPLNATHNIAFFHSSGTMTAKKVITYVMGAYLFLRTPPFTITHMTKEPVMKDIFMNETLGWAYRAVDYIQFPMGLVIDEDFLYVSYGRNDRDSWIVKLDKAAFIADLKPVRTNVLGVSDVDSKGKIIPNTYKVIKSYT